MKWIPLITCIFLCGAVPVLSQTDPQRVSPVVEAVNKVGPAVVNISTENVVTLREFNPFGNDWIFEYFTPYNQRNITRQSLGSGVVIREDGIILTNEHIILPASKITVTLSNGKEYEADLMGASRRFDLALLKIHSDEPLPYLVPAESSDLMIGETVIAIGNPFGLSSTVTTGVISALNRTITFKDAHSNTTHTYRDFIQTDASINPGNSGGPLLNINGELIGINTAIYAEAQGIGFAIPIEKANRIIDDLLEKGIVPRIWLGVHVQDLTPLLSRHFNFGDLQGVLISEVLDGSPGSHSGLAAGNIITAINGESIRSSEEFKERLKEFTPGDTITFNIWTKEKNKTVSLVAIELPMNQAEEIARELLGLTAQDVTDQIVRTRRLFISKGAIVTHVESSSPASKVGIRPGDVIVKIDQDPIDNTDQFYKALQKSAHQDAITAVIVRGSVAYHVTLEIE
ncbi:trypsin-like peptidase domain-containing protein [bacterium]|nr:trypsin-like peptidase domain-containing protein [candidate division CSSED10-310 bacterium]